MFKSKIYPLIVKKGFAVVLYSYLDLTQNFTSNSEAMNRIDLVCKLNDDKNAMFFSVNNIYRSVRAQCFS